MFNSSVRARGGTVEFPKAAHDQEQSYACLIGTMRIMAKFDTVLFDWMLTLVHYPTSEEHLVRAMHQLNRSQDPIEVSEMVFNIRLARDHPEARAASAVEDTSCEAHAHSEFLVYRKAGLDDELANILYGMLGTPGFHPPYSDSKPVLETLKAAGYAIGIVSDIHTDLRMHAKAFGWTDFISGWSLSRKRLRRVNRSWFLPECSRA